MGRTLYLLINIINKHLLDIGYVHDNSNKEDFSRTVVQIQFLTQQGSASFGNLLENANFRASPQTYWVRSCGAWPTNLFFFQLVFWFWCRLKFKNSCPVGASSLDGEIRSPRGERTMTPANWGGGHSTGCSQHFFSVGNKWHDIPWTTHFKDCNWVICDWKHFLEAYPFLLLGEKKDIYIKRSSVSSHL